MEQRKRDFVIDRELFEKVLKQVGDRLKEKEIVMNYISDKDNKIFTYIVDLKKYNELGLNEDLDEIVSNIIFVNIKDILVDLGYEKSEIEEKVVLVPVHSVAVDKNKIIVNY